MIELLVSIVLCIAMIGVMVYDARHYIIPNWLNSLLLVLYVAWAFVSPQPVDWLMGLAMLAILLLCGFGFFALGMLGAGDVKLMAVLGLYVGLTPVAVKFLLYMAILGGVLSMVVATARKILHYKENKPRIFTPKAPVPYGLAIAGSFLILLLVGDVAGMPALLPFLFDN